MEEELDRKIKENEKLSQMLRVMYEKYINLQKQVMCLLKQNSEVEGGEEAVLRKRRTEGSEEYENCSNNNTRNNGNEEFNRWFIKRPRILNNANSKVSKVFVQKEASDPSLVYIFILFYLIIN